MLDIIGIVGILFSTKEIIKEKIERKQSITYFNWDEYWKDVNKQTNIIREKYNLSENINVLEWMHNKIFN